MAGRPGLDVQSREMIYSGLNQSQLCRLFRLDNRTVAEKIREVPPSGERNGVPIWRVHEVAPYLVKPMYDIEEYIKRMHHTDLPKMLTKEFWAGQRSKQEYLARAGDLWPTDDVIKKVGDLMKLFAMACRLACDSVERQTDLTERQRSIIQSIMDGTLRDLRAQVIQHFGEKAREEDEEDESL